MTGPTTAARTCHACGEPVHSGRFEDRTTGVVYHTMCFATALTGVGAPGAREQAPVRPHPAEILSWITEEREKAHV
jgi:hypothetical protein